MEKETVVMICIGLVVLIYGYNMIAMYIQYKNTETIKLEIGQKFIGTLMNGYKDEILSITQEMIDNDEETLHFLHYNGFEMITDGEGAGDTK